MGEAYRVSVSKISLVKYLLITDSVLPRKIDPLVPHPKVKKSDS